MVLMDEISKVLTEAPKEEIPTNIERANQVQNNSETDGKQSNNTPPYLVAKIAN